MDSIYDWLLLGLTVASTLPFLVANGALIVQRRRSYFQAQGGVSVIVCGSLAGLVWIYSFFLNNGHFTLRGIFRKCRVWSFGTLALGMSLWFVFNIIRFHRMQLISEGKTGWYHRYSLFIALCILFNITFSVISTELSSVTNSESCATKKSWGLVGLFFLCAPYLVLSTILLYMFRRRTDPLVVTEYQRTCEYLVMAYFIVLLAATATLTEATESISGRCFLTFCTSCLVFSHFWVRFAYPIYLCLFKPEEEMDRYEEELSLSGARALQVISSVYSSQGLYPPSSEGAVFEAFYKASTEVDIYKDILQKLREEKEVLQKERWDSELELQSRSLSRDEGQKHHVLQQC